MADYVEHNSKERVVVLGENNLSQRKYVATSALDFENIPSRINFIWVCCIRLTILAPLFFHYDKIK